MEERRRSPRHAVRFELVFDDGNAFNAGVVSNVSDEGLFLETDVPFPIGTVVRILWEDAGSAFDVRAAVVRTTATNDDERAGMGLELTDREIDGRPVGALIRALEPDPTTPRIRVLLPAAPTRGDDDRCDPGCHHEHHHH